MFDNAQVREYKSIKAPDELRRSVLENCKSRKKRSGYVYKISGLAACLAVIIALSLAFGGGSGAEIFTGGISVGDAPASLTAGASPVSARAYTGLSLEVELHKTSVITSNDGAVNIYDYETGIELSGEITPRKVSVIWNVFPEDTDRIYVLEIADNRETTKVALTFDKDAGWQISRSRAKN